MQDTDERIEKIILSQLEEIRKEQKVLSDTVLEFLAKHPYECDDKHRQILEAAKEYVRYKIPKEGGKGDMSDDDEPKRHSFLFKGFHKIAGDYTNAIKWTIILMILGAVMAYLHLSNKTQIEHIASDIHTIQMKGR